MQSRRGSALFLVLLIAAAIVAEPMLHTHPLTRSSHVPCAVCVGSVVRISPPSTIATSPLIVVSTIATIVIIAAGHHGNETLPSRAPPAA